MLSKNLDVEQQTDVQMGTPMPSKDSEKVKNRTNGPYLIGPDGYYVRDGSTNKPLVWDPVDNRAKTFNAPSIKDYTLESEYTVEGVTAKPSVYYLPSD